MHAPERNHGQSPPVESSGDETWRSSIPEISDQEFALFQSLIYREAGIYLGPSKTALLVGRLAKRLRTLGLRSFAAYYRRVAKLDPVERTRMLDCITTNETRFFREPRQFELLEQRILPGWAAEGAAGRRSRHLRVWSAGCSTGEEPYSLAMVLLHHLPPAAGWSVEILATDLSGRVLERAQEGIWPLDRSSEIPPALLKQFMLRGTRSQEGKMKVGPELRAVVTFEHLNLNDDTYRVGRPFDLIFCRNVLIYFDTDSRRRVTERLFRHLASHGYLFLGHAERLSGEAPRGTAVIPTVYTHAAPPSPGPGEGSRR
jgi:chemotaxis protein methyltransferase CheR